MTAVRAFRRVEPPSPTAQAEHERLRAARIARNRAVASRCNFAVYGLDATWSGRRWFGGWSESDEELTSIELAHGDAFDETAPLLRVATGRVSYAHAYRHLNLTPEEARRSTIRQAAQALAQHVWHSGADHSPALQATFTAADPTERWSPLSLLVEGQPVQFRSLIGSTSWVTLALVGDAVIAIQARSIEPDAVRLVVIGDLEPYLVDDGLPQ
jgi:hypothetical protein